MRNASLKLSCLVAAFYFGNDAMAQEVKSDTTTRETKIEEVVMIGYGSRKKVDNTTAVSTISSDEVNKTKVLNATQAIQGKAAGVNVIASDLPGSTPTVMIRGLGTVKSGRDPLYVVDGIYVDNINNINSNDILTYDVLKDASALAIYGNRGANGVIIITTKSGKGRGIQVEYDGFAGVRSPLKKVKMASSSQFARYTNLALEAQGNAAQFSENQLVNTNWFDAITRTGIYNQHNISVSGASESAKYFLSLGNYDEKSILNGTDYNRTTIRTNNEFKITKGIILSQNLSIAFTNTTPKPLSAFTNAYKQSPIVPVYFSDGIYGVSFVNSNGVASPNGSSSFNNVGNPLAQLDFYNQRQNNFLLQGGLKLDFSILKPLKFTSSFSGEYNNYKSYNFSDLRAIWLAADPTRKAADFNAKDGVNNLTNEKSNYFNWVLSNYLTYSQKFGEHDIEIMAGMEASVKNGLERTVVLRKDVYENSDYWDLSDINYVTATNGNLVSFNSIKSNKNTTSSYFARAQYKLMNRYLLTASIRRDGSSQFSDGNKWGTFPAFGLGWVVSEEGFMQNSGFDMLKLRGGWGRLGNQNVPLNILTLSSSDSYSYSFNGNAVSNGVTVDKIYDPNLSWEITEETSAGVDFELLNRRLYGSVDWYNRRTKNIILDLGPVPTSGLSNNGLAHMGEVTNKGLEFVLGWKDRVGEDFTYGISANFSHNQNKLTKVFNNNVAFITGGGLGNGQYTKLFNYTTVGHSLGSFWLWKFDGYDENGNMKYADTNGNGKTGKDDLDDRVYFDSYIPKSTYGINIDLSYKNVDFSVNGYGTLGAKVYNGKKAQRFSGENIEKSVATDYWTASNTDASNPAPFNSSPIASDFYLESGDFFRINNITLGYTFNDPMDKVKAIRLYFSAVNPIIFQKFSGYTPELAGDNDPYGSAGIELDAYPAVRSFLVGLNVKF